MERKLDDLTIGYQERIDFSKFVDNNHQHESTFRLMATPDGKSYVIIYQWIDPMKKIYNDKEEAFYIDGINEDNKEKAKNIFLDVHDGLQSAFQEDPNQVFETTPLVEETISKYSNSKKM